MKILIFDYCGDAVSILKELGYKHQQTLTTSHIDYFILIDKFLDNGLSVMLEKNSRQDVDYIIFVDKHGRRFKQRYI